VRRAGGRAQEVNVVFSSDANVLRLPPGEPEIPAEFIDHPDYCGETQPLPAINFAMNEGPEPIVVLTDGVERIGHL
jgi:hypothetical protein